MKNFTDFTDFTEFRGYDLTARKSIIKKCMELIPPETPEDIPVLAQTPCYFGFGNKRRSASYWENPAEMLKFQQDGYELHLKNVDDDTVPYFMPWFGTGVLVSAFGCKIKPATGDGRAGPRNELVLAMPFRKSALVTLTNESGVDADIVAYRVLYKLHDIPEDAAYFHAQYRRTVVTENYPEHIILDGVKSRGLYVGTYCAYNVFVNGWWGEGEVKFWLDGDEYPSMADNGTEDYFGGTWCFYGDGGKEQTFSSPYLGMPLAKWDNQHGPRKYSMYRWYILDSIGFSEDIKVAVQSLGWYPPGVKPGLYRPIPMDIMSVAYWYQAEPHIKFPQIMLPEKRCDM